MRLPSSFLVHALVLAAGLAASAPARVGGSTMPSGATLSSEAQLVILAEPQPPAGIATSSGAITLPYRVVEVFSGEPGAASVVVRHPQLDPMDRQRLGSGERVIVMARPDAQNPGRWLGSAPLRATDEAVAAFRKWGAPSDVREARPLSEVVAVAQQAEPAPSSETARPMPLSMPAEVPAPVEVEDESVAAEPTWHDVPVAEVDEAAAAVAPEAPTQPAGRVAAVAATERGEALPETGVLPTRGPGLPPAPTRRILGPSAAERDDLKAAEPAKG